MSDTDSIASCFPMKLSDMERLHLARDSARAPNVIFCFLAFEGAVDPVALRAAIEVLGKRHPLIGAQVSDNGKVWVGRADIWYTLVCHQGPFVEHEFRGRGCDLRADQNVHFDLFVDHGRSYLMVEIHHSQVDGVGGLQAVADLLLAYHNLVLNRPPTEDMRLLDPGALKRRNRLGLFSKGFVGRLPYQWMPVFGAIKFGMARISPLKKQLKTSAVTASGNFPSVVHRKISADTQALLAAKAEERSVTINDVLLAGLFRGVNHWQQAHNVHRGKNESTRVLVPVNLRDISDRRCGACNRMAFVQLDRKGKVLNDPNGLIWSVNYEFGIVRRFRFEKTTAIVLRLMALIPGFLERNIARPKCRATTLLSNVGAPFKRLKLPRKKGKLLVGNHLLTDVRLIAPYYELTPAVFLYSQYAGQPAITLSYDASVLTVEEAESLFDAFLEAVQTY